MVGEFAECDNTPCTVLLSPFFTFLPCCLAWYSIATAYVFFISCILLIGPPRYKTRQRTSAEPGSAEPAATGIRLFNHIKTL